MRVLFSLFISCFAPVFVFAQLTIVLTSIPSNTPAGATIYVAGSFNTWNPGSAAHAFTKLPDGTYTLTINPPAGVLEFKFTQGSWATVEGNASGGFLPNRTYNYTGQPTTLPLSILSWEGSGTGASTAAANVSILDNAFYIPQLNRTRRIWLYLPPDYATTAKRFPVLYMHDGQNLFDKQTAFSGEWEVDESLNKLHQQGDYGCIVVGIDNGGGKRLDEYSPWLNTSYGEGGEGDAYMQFIANTLKPHIDSLYRTLPGRVYTGLMGSSMGGLISMYGLINRQDVFAKAGIFSPAFWFAGNNSVNHVSTTGKQNGDVRVYFLAGGAEPASVTQNMNAVADAMLSAGFTAGEQYRLTPADGQHAEWFWAREFPAAYKWLFAGVVTASGQPEAAPDLAVSPNPAADQIRVSGLAAGQNCDIRIFSSDGRLQRQRRITGNQPVSLDSLPPGFYFVHLKPADAKAQIEKLVIKN